MKYKTGDKVRFLSSQGGGIVTRVVGDLVFVEIEDGFEIPVMPSELVVIDSDEPAARAFQRKGEFAEKRDATADAPISAVSLDQTSEKVIITNTPKKYAKGVYLVFVPDNQDAYLNGQLMVYLVNYTTHDLLFNLVLNQHPPGFKPLARGTVAAGTAELIESLLYGQTDRWAHGVVQMILHTAAQTDIPEPISVGFSCKASRLLKQENYNTNPFFDEAALVIPLIEMGSWPMSLNAGDGISKALPQMPKANVAKPLINKYMLSDGFAEVDLHIEKLREDHKSMDPVLILQAQLDQFKSCLESAIAAGLQRVVFIHGVGVGTLKTEIKKILRAYEFIEFEDAPVNQYGIGATDVRIRKG